MQNIWNLRLRNAPRPVKALALGYVLSLSLAYVYAIGNIAFVVGLSPKDIAVHYYGAEKKIEEAPVVTGEEEISMDDLISEVEKVADGKAEKPAETMEEPETLGPRPSFKNIVAIGHFHLFGMSSFFFGLALLGLFTSVSDKFKTCMVFIPFIAVIIDNLSFLATRFGGPHFAYLTAIAGTIMGLSFATLWITIVLELIKKPEAK